ncbi:hypothetical protein HanRHA438_Chr11g0521961 [Helianthus annuus]|nr:hypothetical protein HanRHA438_Chr11g0521961 [Helianthus annuus]
MNIFDKNNYVCELKRSSQIIFLINAHHAQASLSTRTWSFFLASYNVIFKSLSTDFHR